jgi:hypothetical protein
MEIDVTGSGPVPPTFSLLVLVGPMCIERHFEDVHAYSREDERLILCSAEEIGPGRLRYRGFAMFPPGSWHGIIRVAGEPKEIKPSEWGFTDEG